MPMIILPSHPRRAWLTSFWVVLCALAGAGVGALLSICVGPRWFAGGIALAVILALPGVLRPGAVAVVYDLWNRLAHIVARVVRLVITAVCFFGIFVVVGRAGSSLRLTRPTSPGSLWVPRGTTAESRFLHPHEITGHQRPPAGWVRTYVAWAVRSRHWWALTLLPFLWLRNYFAHETDRIFPANIYTLF